MATPAFPPHSNGNTTDQSIIGCSNISNQPQPPAIATLQTNHEKTHEAIPRTPDLTSGYDAPTNPARIPLLDNDPVIVYESPSPTDIYAYSPGITRLPTGRLVASMDQGGEGVKALPEVTFLPDGNPWRGKIYTSDDRGQTWTHRSDMPLVHARPFCAGGSIYIIGHFDDLGLMRSQDDGLTWEGPFWFTQGERWHQAPANVLYTNGRIYLVMERQIARDFPLGWPVAVLAPVVMAADLEADLTQRGSWTFSNELTYQQAIEQAGPPHLNGVPFYPNGHLISPEASPKRHMAPAGWLETNIIQFHDPDHTWYDPSGRTFHLWMRAHTGITNLAAIAKVVESPDGALTVSLETSPIGDPILHLPCPGGQMKFHILYDEEMALFWLLSSQSTDSTRRPDRLPPDRYGLPDNERHRLVLHFSTNMVDWCFAGRVADTGAYGQSRNYASMVIDGDDLHILARSGDARAKNTHDGNLITFHTVHNFRGLVY